MFVRWQARKRASRAFGVGLDTDTHWAAILAESARINGKPTQQHVAYLGGITHSAIEIAAQRAFFWKEVMHQLDQLANRVLKDDRARIEEVIAKKVPRLTRQEYDGCVARRVALAAELGTDFGDLPSFQICGCLNNSDQPFFSPDQQNSGPRAVGTTLSRAPDSGMASG